MSCSPSGHFECLHSRFRWCAGGIGDRASCRHHGRRYRDPDYVGCGRNHCHILMHGMMQAVETLSRPEESNYHPRTRVASHAMSATDVSAIYPPAGLDLMYRRTCRSSIPVPSSGKAFPGSRSKPQASERGGLGGPAVRSGDHLASGRVDTVCPVAPTSTSALVRVRLLSVLELPIQTEQVILVHAQRHVDHHREPDRVTSTLLTIQVRYIVPVPRFSEFCRTSPSDLRSRVSALIKLHPHT
jgi:hypothetical protein